MGETHRIASAAAGRQLVISVSLRSVGLEFGVGFRFGAKPLSQYIALAAATQNPKKKNQQT